MALIQESSLDEDVPFLQHLSMAVLRDLGQSNDWDELRVYMFRNAALSEVRKASFQKEK